MSSSGGSVCEYVEPVRGLCERPLVFHTYDPVDRRRSMYLDEMYLVLCQDC